MSQIRRMLLIALGTFFVLLGVVGIFVPLIPTTSPLLVAAWCYARSSPRFYHWLLNNPWFGAYIRNYREGRGLPARSKAVTLATLWLGIGATVLLIQPRWWVDLLLLAVAVGVTIHIVMLKTLRPEPPVQAAEPRP